MHTLLLISQSILFVFGNKIIQIIFNMDADLCSE